MTNTYGTIAFQLVELLRDGKLSKAVDVYSFAMLTWELYTGERIYADSIPSQVRPALMPARWLCALLLRAGIRIMISSAVIALKPHGAVDLLLCWGAAVCTSASNLRSRVHVLVGSHAVLPRAPHHHSSCLQSLRAAEASRHLGASVSRQVTFTAVPCRSFSRR